MEIDVTGIIKTDRASLGVDFEGSIAGLEDAADEYAFDRPVIFKGTVTNDAGTLKLEGVLSAAFTGRCARCLEAVRIEIRIPITEEFVRINIAEKAAASGHFSSGRSENRLRRDKAGPGHAAVNTPATVEVQDPEGKYRITGNILVPDKAFIDNIILSLPVKLLCRNTCKGICPGCGADLNVAACSCGKGNNSKAGKSRKDSEKGSSNGNGSGSIGGILADKLKDVKFDN